jgi:hypothetical protein
VASPIVLEFSMTFMTNAPFLACMCIGLFLCTRAIRKQSYLLMVTGGLAGSAAILTRQFGIALIPALVLTWALGNNRKESIGLFVSGLAPLLLASSWQIYSGLVTPNWTGIIRSHEQIEFLHIGIPWNLWRFVVWWNTWRCLRSLVLP